jgi:hypothetical protein
MEYDCVTARGERAGSRPGAGQGGAGILPPRGGVAADLGGGGAGCGVAGRQRENAWVEVGLGVALPAGSARMHGLTRAGECARPDCLRVGCGETGTQPEPCHKCGEGLRLPGSILCYACTQRERVLVEMAKSANGHPSTGSG